MPSNINISNFLKGLNQDYLPRARKAMAIGVNEFASFVLGESQELAPVKTGFLKASGFLKPASDTELRATIGFNADYAVYVHENTEAHHSQGRSKFLETPMRDHASEFTAHVIKKLQAEFGGGG